MDEQKKIDIDTAVKTEFTSEYLRPAANVFGDVFDAIDIFLKDKITVDSCEKLYFDMEAACDYATQHTCNIVRNKSMEIASVRKGSEPCEACPFNKFCSYAYNQSDESWHFNMIKISDRLNEIIRKGEVTQKDIDYINACYDKMKVAPEYSNLHKLLDEWGK